MVQVENLDPPPGVNSINVLLAAYMREDPKFAIRQSFCAFGTYASYKLKIFSEELRPSLLTLMKMLY